MQISHAVREFQLRSSLRLKALRCGSASSPPVQFEFIALNLARPAAMLRKTGKFSGACLWIFAKREKSIKKSLSI
jgi:hypothetical protein